MKPWMSTRVLLLLGAIIFVGLMIWIRTHPQKTEEPLADAVAAIARNFGLEIEPLPGPKGGLTVKAVHPSSPGEHLGFRAGDRILAVGDQSVWHAINLLELLTLRLQRGMPAPVLVESNGVYHSIILGRGPRPAGKPAR